MRFAAFLLSCLGGINWFMIGVLQYDFIAGIFGAQANIFSRLIYAFIGVSSIYILAVTTFSKGRLKLFNYKAKQPKIKREIEDF